MIRKRFSNSSRTRVAMSCALMILLPAPSFSATKHPRIFSLSLSFAALYRCSFHHSGRYKRWFLQTQSIHSHPFTFLLTLAYNAALVRFWLSESVQLLCANVNYSLLAQWQRPWAADGADSNLLSHRLSTMRTAMRHQTASERRTIAQAPRVPIGKASSMSTSRRRRRGGAASLLFPCARS